MRDSDRFGHFMLEGSATLSPASAAADVLTSLREVQTVMITWLDSVRT